MELYHKWVVAQGKEGELIKVRTYSASQRCQHDVQSLSRIGLDTRQISNALEIHQYTVEHHKARLEEEEIRRRDFMLTGNPVERKWRGGYFAILQK